MAKRMIATIGERFGKAVVLADLGLFATRSGQHRRRVRAICDCGDTFEVLFSSLVQGNTNSCGCLYTQKRNGPRPAPVPGAKCIPLTQGKFALVDEGDFESLSRFTWGVAKSKENLIYALSRRAGGYMHRVLLKADKTQQVDHIDGNPLNNRRSNLRFCNHSQNGQNKKRSRTPGASSVFKGVSLDRNGRRWVFCIGPKRTPLVRRGGFETAAEAARGYDEVARRVYREFARVNFPLPHEQPALVAAEVTE